MTPSQKRLLLTAVAVAVWGSAAPAQAQTIVNLTNLDPTNGSGYGTGIVSGGAALNASTSLDLLNTTTALTNGGLFPGAVSSQSQTAYNQLNTIGINANGTVSPVVLGNSSPVVGGPNMVEINTITSAYNSASMTTGSSGSANTLVAGTSATINNINAAVSSAINPIIGGTNNGPWTGGYGGAASGALVTANQVGVNTINGVGAAFADGTNVALSQLPGAPTPNGTATSPTFGTTPVIQGGSLNMSTTNTLLAYATAGTVGINGNNGVDSSGNPIRGNQTAVNTFNASTLVGTNLAVGSQQLADGLNNTQTTLASINRALAYSPGSQAANIDPSVTNLNQTAAVGVNALNLQQGGSTATTATLSGLQSVGYNTSGEGATPIPVVTNQIVASTTGSGGFMAQGAGAEGSAADWAGFASTVALGMPQPGTYTSRSQQNASAFLTTPTFNPLVNAGEGALNAGTVNIASVGQAINLTNNTVSAGSTAAPVDVQFGPAGFQQRTGNIGIASYSTSDGSGFIGAAGLSNAQANTGVGAASISTLTQTFQSANNTFQGSGNVTGSLTQAASGVTFNAATIASGTGVADAGGVSVNGGSGMAGYAVDVDGGVVPQNTVGYGLVSPSTGGSALNTASATSAFGRVNLTNVGQTSTTLANIATTPGTVSTGADGTLAQSLGAISNYGAAGSGYQVGQNSALAASVASGNVATSGLAQSANLTGNAVQAAVVNGSVAQLAAGSGEGGLSPNNTAITTAGQLGVTGQGSAAMTNTTQSNVVSLNSINSAGALGSSTLPAAFSQQSGTSDGGKLLTAAPAFTAFPSGSVGPAETGATVNNAMLAPSNLSVVSTTGGAGASASSTGSVQQAALNVNSLVGGTSGGLGITGNATQVSYGQSTAIGNQALAYANNTVGAVSQTQMPSANVASGSTMLGANGVMSGNATLLNQQQLSTQSLNTMALAGANNGNLNQATFGATNQTTGNQLYAQSNGGYALTTGAQTATNAVNVITAR